MLKQLRYRFALRKSVEILFTLKNFRPIAKWWPISLKCVLTFISTRTYVYVVLYLQNPKGFTLDLLEFLNSHAQYLHSLIQLQAANPQSALTAEAQLKIKNVQMALTALYNVIKNNPGKMNYSLVWCQVIVVCTFEDIYTCSTVTNLEKNCQLRKFEIVCSLLRQLLLYWERLLSINFLGIPRLLENKSSYVCHQFPSSYLVFNPLKQLKELSVHA